MEGLPGSDIFLSLPLTKMLLTIIKHIELEQYVYSEEVSLLIYSGPELATIIELATIKEFATNKDVTGEYNSCRCSSEGCHIDNWLQPATVRDYLLGS